MPRVDGLEKVTGRAEFVADVSLPGMLWGAILRSPHPHARIRAIDTSRARKLPGVRAVVTVEVTSVQPLVSPVYGLGLTEDEVRRLWEEYHVKSIQRTVTDLIPPSDF